MPRLSFHSELQDLEHDLLEMGSRAEAMVRADPANQQWARHKKTIDSVISSIH